MKTAREYCLKSDVAKLEYDNEIAITCLRSQHSSHQMIDQITVMNTLRGLIAKIMGFVDDGRRRFQNHAPELTADGSGLIIHNR